MIVILLIVFVTAVLINSVYFLLFYKGLNSYTVTSEQKKVTEPVSVVIAARNEAENLKKLLPLLYSQTYNSFEIIVVNDRSDDNTFDMLRQEAQNHPNLKNVTVEHLPDHADGKKYALTLGIKAAQYDLILLTDADCIPNSNEWVASMAAGIEDKDFCLGFSYYKKRSGLLNAFIRFETLLTAIQYLGLALVGKPYMGVGRNMMHRKNSFLQNKGFNGFINLTGGDDDLYVNKYGKGTNTRVCIAPAAITLSEPKKSWSGFIKQKLRHLQAGKHYRLETKITLGVFSLSYITSWLLLPILLFLGNELYLVISSFLLRTLLVYLTFNKAMKKVRVSFELSGLVVFEIFFVLYYITIGTIALFTKRVRWN